MVKTIREGKNRRSSRIASSAGTRSKEEQTASQISSPAPMEGDAPVDPMERPDSKFMIAPKQPALTLVALAATEDHGRQLPDSAFASENQAASMNPTSSTDRILISSSATSACIAPSRDSPLFPNESALPQTTGDDLSPPPVGSTDPRKTDAAPSAAASSPRNPPGSDGPTGDACESTSGTKDFRTASMYDATLGTRTLGEVRGPRTSEEDLRRRDGTTASAPGGSLDRVTASFGNPREADGPSRGGALAEGSAFEEPRLRGRDRARLLDGTTASAPGGPLDHVTASFRNPRGTDGPSRGGALAEGSTFDEPRLRGRDRARLLDDTTAGAPGGAFGRITASFGNPRGTDGPSGGGALAEGSVFEESRFLPTRFLLEQRRDPCSSRPDLSSSRQASRHPVLTKLSPSSARHNVSHLGRAPPDFPPFSSSLPHVPSSGYFPDLVRADPLKAQDGHSLEMLQKIKGRSRIEGAAPATKAEGQDTTPGPVSVEQDFAGEEPEAVEVDLAGGESGPSA